ncbi:CDP-diacylglycerol--glycerol-3-phosphate 3-phosphatidyltransferase [Candidatus Izimaplasma bacterium HR1]|jgi:CDP-diacylglycerol--glycerol-3-phosphate 3-phosphatidyltransferase|uniref:CDP-diacylglycerol--glycerol-3-phosphate 3-phosphatidyltransferase n=1 Tax=Candidatus Izimoplasma sp. HR1 TaxID=1541959 RepID=UPI0004F8E316|nr:CDP-diacylglycerol--glycerol-3-phosphate 3-phosphatidyltransferase [Candidatus Izimaplasma bacterium HR1]
MNLPNKISMFRVLLVPVLVVFYYLYVELNNDLFAYFLAPIFIVASLTDFLDGYIARSRNLVTVFGKFIDPLADKLIVMAALIILNALGHIPIWVTIVILSREFIVTGIRLVAVGDGKVIAASNLGKYKTASTMVGLIIMLLFPLASVFTTIGLYIVYLGTVLTIVSGVDYFVKNKEIIMKSI